MVAKNYFYKMVTFTAVLFQIFFLSNIQSHQEEDFDINPSSSGEKELTDAVFTRTDPKIIGDLYQILKVLDIEFTNHGIPYWIDFGTLLGSERHGGIIPWDDDADICVMDIDRSKFNDLMNVLSSYGLSGFCNVNTHNITFPNNNTNFDIVRVYRRGQRYPWVDIFFVRKEIIEDKLAYKLIGRPRSWFPKCYWFEDDIRVLEHVPFGPIHLYRATNGVMRRLTDQYGDDCLEMAVNVTNHGTRNDRRKVRVVNFSPPEYESDDQIISLND